MHMTQPNTTVGVAIGNSATMSRVWLSQLHTQFESYQKIKDAERTVGDIIEALKSGELHKDDFSAEVLEQLRTIIER